MLNVKGLNVSLMRNHAVGSCNVDAFVLYINVFRVDLIKYFLGQLYFTDCY